MHILAVAKVKIYVYVILAQKPCIFCKFIRPQNYCSLYASFFYKTEQSNLSGAIIDSKENCHSVIKIREKKL